MTEGRPRGQSNFPQGKRPAENAHFILLGATGEAGKFLSAVGKNMTPGKRQRSLARVKHVGRAVGRHVRGRPKLSFFHDFSPSPRPKSAEFLG
jgi:hypothetical protein